VTWLNGQVILLTGGGSGLGRALVERFVDEGASVGVLELSSEKTAALRSDFGESIRVIQGDATSLSDNAQAVRETVAAFGGLDTFIGNAAVWDFGRSLEDIQSDALSSAFDEVFALNVKAYLLGAKASLDALRASQGSMIFTLSNAAFYPGGGGPLYTASKHALVGVIKQLAYELAPQIRVNGVAPGGMATDLRGPQSLGLAGTPLSALLPLRVTTPVIMCCWHPGRTTERSPVRFTVAIPGSASADLASTDSMKSRLRERELSAHHCRGGRRAISHSLVSVPRRHRARRH
jgi:2,3-dihydroxy-2,3-dihydrophenylpropionate dehydrogenase